MPLDWLNVSDAGQALAEFTDSSVAPAINPVSDGGAIQAGITDAGGDEDVCVALSATADNVVLPVDIIWVIDSSPSMDDSILIIEENLNAFVEDISSSNLDYHVVLIGSEEDNYDPVMTHQYLGICIPEPLSGASGCPDTDSTDTGTFVGVHSHDALSKVINNYDAYKDFLREDAIAHFVVVTDDDTGEWPAPVSLTPSLRAQRNLGFRKASLSTVWWTWWATSRGVSGMMNAAVGKTADSPTSI